MSTPLFGSTELARRIERAEATLVASGARAAGEPPAIFLRELGGGVASWSRDGSPFNKVAGLGFESGVDDETMGEVEREIFARGAAVQVELANLGDPAIGALLTARGYRLVNFENVLGRALAIEEVPAIAEGVEVGTIAAGEFDLWLDTVVEGFAHPNDQGVASHEEFPREMLRQVMRDLTAVEGFAHYLARLDGSVAGGGSLRVAEEVAQLAGAATLPAHRRKGVQSSLLAARLHDACLAGCDVAVVTTQPGSKSQQNAQRHGFHLLYTRAVLVKAAG